MWNHQTVDDGCVRKEPHQHELHYVRHTSEYMCAAAAAPAAERAKQRETANERGQLQMCVIKLSFIFYKFMHSVRIQRFFSRFHSFILSCDFGLHCEQTRNASAFLLSGNWKSGQINKCWLLRHLLIKNDVRCKPCDTQITNLLHFFSCLFCRFFVALRLIFEIVSYVIRP